MENFKKISISALTMEMPALGADAEGKLRGGFSIATFSEGSNVKNGNCGCAVSGNPCDIPALSGCGSVTYDDGNCYCVPNPTKEPTTTTGSTAGAGQNFGMNFSMLF